MNHIAAVTVPILGAWLWRRYDNYQIPFQIGVAIAIVSLFATRLLPSGSSARPKVHVEPVATPPQEEIAPVATST